jgi:hypothetical protein
VLHTKCVDFGDIILLVQRRQEGGGVKLGYPVFKAYLETGIKHQQTLCGITCFAGRTYDFTIIYVN